MAKQYIAISGISEEAIKARNSYMAAVRAILDRKISAEIDRAKRGGFLR